MKIPQIVIDEDRDNKYKKYFRYTENKRLSVIKGYLFDNYTQKDLDIEFLDANPDSHKGRESNNITRYIGLTGDFRGLFSGMSLQSSILELKSTKDSLYGDLISILKKLKCKELHSNPTIWSMNVSTRENHVESWNIFKNNSCICIDYMIDDVSTDYSQFETKEEIREYLNVENLNKPELIYRFVNDIEIGDIFIAHKGSKVLSGIGIVESDYIHDNENLHNIRKISWFYTPGDLKINDNDFFNTNNIVKLNDLSGIVNEFLARVASKDKKIRINLLKFLFNKFYEEFHSKEIGKDHSQRYESGALKIQNEWNNLKEKKSNGENWHKYFWKNIFHRDLELFTVGGRSLRNKIQSKSRNTINLSDDDMDNLANEFFDTANNLLNEDDIDEQKRILDSYSNDDHKSYGFQTGTMSPILFYLDESKFYPINSKTIKTVRFLSIILGSEINLSNKLNEYMDSNDQYKNFLKDLKNNFYFEKLNIGDIKVFDEFCHWFCDKELGYYVDDNKNEVVNIFPVKEIFKYNIKRLNMFESDKPRNLIYFGAPGTGKSFTLNKDKDELEDCIFERVTFHPDYSYANFVGTYKPVPKDEDKISYEYVPGPFMRILTRAYAEPTKPFLLIIEEINRANVAAVFGDVFQLLDRDDNGNSRFLIQTSEDMREYLRDKLGDCEYVEDFSSIGIPSNLFIWATMNSADQGVFPMDTAFKRRWEFEYLGINAGSDKIEGININWESHENWKRFKSGKDSWDEIRKAINEQLSEMGINEDKQLGPFFAFTEYINEDGTNDNVELGDFIKIFRDKILMYLFEDVAKYKKDLFYKENLSYSQLRDEFEDKGFEVFCKSIRNKLLEDNDE